jgi:DNA-binding beta-propeller fold protein YncE
VITCLVPELAGSPVAYAVAPSASVMGAASRLASQAQTPASAAATRQPGVAYAAGGGFVTPVATATNKAARRIPAASGGTIGNAAVVTPDGKTLYVLDFAGAVVPVSTHTRTAQAAIPVPGNPTSLAISPDGATLYVTSENARVLTPISTATNTAGTSVPVCTDGGTFGTGSTATVLTDVLSVAVTPNGKTLYVGCVSYDLIAEQGNGYLIPIDVATGTQGTHISFVNEPVDLAITPNGKTLYVAGQASGDHSSGSTIVPIDTATRTIGMPLPVTGGASSIVIGPDGRSAYVGASTITPLNLPTGTFGAAATVGDLLGHPAFAPDGKTLYLPTAYFGGDIGDAHFPGLPAVTPWTTGTNKPGASVFLWNYAEAMAVAPDQAPVAALHVTGAPHGKASFFNAAGSQAVTGRIVSYRWKFGDGSSAASTSPYAWHTYAKAGTYSASVTVTDTAGTSTSVVFTGHAVLRNGGPSARATATVTAG